MPWDLFGAVSLSAYVRFARMSAQPERRVPDGIGSAPTLDELDP
jgi:hypothetical protein